MVNESHDAGGSESDERAAAHELAAWEISSVVSSALIAEWVALAFAPHAKAWLAVPVALALALMIFSHRTRNETLRDIGFRTDNFVKTLRLLALPMLVCAILMFVFGFLLRRYDAHSLTSDKWWRGGARAALWLFARGAAWGLLQEYVLQGFVNRRAQMIWGKGWRSLLLVAFVFAALHLPNPALTAATFAAGLIFGWAYQRAPNLYALALAHCAGTIALVSAVPMNYLHDLRVGYKFFG